jgi:hypothetical protein
MPLRSGPVLILASLITASPVLAQRAGPGRSQDSVAMDTTFYGPAYRFTGDEDSLLLARVFEATLRLGRADAGTESPEVVCLGLGRQVVNDPPLPVLRSVADSGSRVVPASACTRRAADERHAVVETATGTTAWALTISALVASSSDTVITYSRHYVGFLWAAGWVCRAVPRGRDWRVIHCHLTWIS